MRQLKITKSITNRESQSLDKYLQEIGREELITAEKEVELAQRIKQGDQLALEKLTKANGTRTGWTYTHKPIENNEFAEQNKQAIRKANQSNFTINISSNSVEQAEKYFEQGFPSVVVVPENQPEKTITKTGKKLVVCPEQTGKAESCAKCLLCARKNRKVIIGFRVHGSGKNKISFN